MSIPTELLDILAESVTIRDAGGDIVYANRAALAHLGFGSLAELKRRPRGSIIEDYIVEDEHGRPLTTEDIPSVRLIHGRPAAPVLMRATNRVNGQVRWHVLKATPIRATGGEFLGAMSVIEDVTEIKTAEMHTRILAESGRTLASSLDYHQTLENVANLAVPALADWCAVDLVDARNRREHVVAAHRDPAKQELARRLRDWEPEELDADQALGRVFQTGTSELFDVTDAQLAQGAKSAEHLQLLRELHIRSVAIVPMSVPTRTLGLMTLVTAESRRRLGQRELALAEQLARRAAVAVENSTLHTTLARVAETLQQSLLPDNLPSLPAWEAAALYRPVETEQRIDIGGDFYDFFERDGTWFAIVGDVAGKGVAAASVTGLLRHGARVASRSEPRPGAILALLDSTLEEDSRGALCTAACVRLDDDRVVISSAGHPPAILVRPDGTMREMSPSGPLLGAFPGSHWPEEAIDIGRDDLLVLYTDGVTETNGGHERFGSGRLRALLAEHAGRRPQDVLDRLEVALDEFRVGPRTDDVAVIALRRRD